jgi:hypothetical protein
MVQLSMSGFQMTGSCSDVPLSDHGGHLVFRPFDNRTGDWTIVWLLSWTVIYIKKILVVYKIV